MQTSRGVLALAFSGGLDTSYCVPRLAEAGWTVHTVFVNTGGSTPAQRAAIRAQAQAVGAVQHHEVDARQLVYDRFVRYLVQGNTPTTARLVEQPRLTTHQAPATAPSPDAAADGARSILFPAATVYVAGGQLWRKDAAGNLTGPF